MPFIPGRGFRARSTVNTTFPERQYAFLRLPYEIKRPY
ncbi:MAG: hypothetical protein JWL99_5356, partial [Streptomyces oryziradicis]|nr:hypothetical protein [Actinacidiphila oryziradicis]